MIEGFKQFWICQPNTLAVLITQYSHLAEYLLDFSALCNMWNTPHGVLVRTLTQIYAHQCNDY